MTNYRPSVVVTSAVLTLALSGLSLLLGRGKQKRNEVSDLKWLLSLSINGGK
ncbi:hypothetical protein [Lactiplantibacillus paraplantarum]|uniref:hypothetical protein n=1 Tax=Lactiplantibacillus paraplantarum TaxID=60520 RepID=UPI0020734BCA|nr:hypothetical protein [Lactiplantibacillus paraplantarum]